MRFICRSLNYLVDDARDGVRGDEEEEESVECEPGEEVACRMMISLLHRDFESNKD